MSTDHDAGARARDRRAAPGPGNPDCVKGHSQSSSTTIVSQTGQGNVIGSGNYDQYGLVNLQVDGNNILSNIGLGNSIV